MSDNSARHGVLCALGAYFIWSLAPAYFKLIAKVPANDILAHRIFWSVVFMLVLLARAMTSVAGRQQLAFFILAVNHHHMLKSSLGYFINPMVTVLLGMLFLTVTQT